jgi:transposase InsO family protein
MDTSRYVRFARPGHAVTGDRTSNWADKQRRDGIEFAHAVIDDHSRLAYVELHPDERAATVVGFTERALAWYAERGIHAQRVMTDNAWVYTRSPRLRALLAECGVRHLTIQPHRPQTNGKIERFHQTMAREWAYGLTYRSSTHRAHALPHWLNHYNEQRPHSALGNRPPISRVRNL